MYVTQDAEKQLTVVNPAVAPRVALQGISGIALFLVRHKYETQRLPPHCFTSTLCHTHSFRFPIYVLSLSIQFFQFPVALPLPL
jgi:hypothetical protein